jgi:hypothetical protein
MGSLIADGAHLIIPVLVVLGGAVVAMIAKIRK